ncbi:MAG: putative 2-aminoethylphosphonate ABC transporter substrate-binding protein [Coriobacteriia bacterium]|nr:putative 2-aminoethylphosphonate ABC transporter substrate-binding protein [Coriobacteriia bacterium]MCL2749886.1 putative 2-aminoethylphosphonate ABC transporter substrate-binding protein [Coriobacteriia bacterium]
MYKNKKTTLVIMGIMALVVTMLAGLLVGCAGSTASTTDSQAASVESTDNSQGESGEITVYTALEDEQIEEYLKVFNASYPNIKVNIVRESTGIITARLLAEKDNPQADLVWGTAASSLLVLDENNMLEPYAPAGVENILPQFKSDKSIPTWVGIDVWETAFAVNIVELEKLGLTIDDIKSYDDLLRPELQGHIVMPNPASSGTGLLTVTGILQIKGKDTDAGWKYLSDLHENIDQYVHSGSKPAKMAGAGECVIGISFGYACIKQVREGLPVEVVFPAEGSGWDLEANALMKKNTINPAALTFLDWAISDEAMALYKENYPILANGRGGTYDGISGDPVKQLIDNDLAWVAANREDILTQWNEKFDGKTVAQ